MLRPLLSTYKKNLSRACRSANTLPEVYPIISRLFFYGYYSIHLTSPETLKVASLLRSTVSIFTRFAISCLIQSTVRTVARRWPWGWDTEPHQFVDLSCALFLTRLRILWALFKQFNKRILLWFEKKGKKIWNRYVNKIKENISPWLPNAKNVMILINFWDRLMMMDKNGKKNTIISSSSTFIVVIILHYHYH